jgi:alkylhydroperoxidase family enzyme
VPNQPGTSRRNLPCGAIVRRSASSAAVLGASQELVTALRDRRPLPDERLAAIQRFTLDVVAEAGAVSLESLEAFLDHGYTTRNALDVVLSVGTYTMSTLANRMTRAPLDEQFSAFAWEEPVA